eukprot:TRINITY_DN21142_c0_g1_i1.p1 TRINITY_DN21142_c0_g1~~TRINITY_DN21142_c0_g1_i1.p1  ORF type:complete len:372 (+),score=106.59 TRINITY_DN21142_c0_g1_i1:29-1144(+)
MTGSAMREAEEEALSARLFAIEFKLQQLERHLQSVDAGQLMGLSRQVELTCNEVIGLSAAQDQRNQDEALQAMFVARVTSAISATAAECASVRRALQQLESGLPRPLESEQVDEQIVSIQRRMLAQIEKAELNDERMQELQQVPLLAMPLDELQRLREAADSAAHTAEALLKRAGRLGKRSDMTSIRCEAAAHATAVDFLLKIANSSPDGSIELMDAEQLRAVIAHTCEQIHSASHSRPDPAALAALQTLATETRAEADRQRSTVEHLVSVAGAPSDYEQSALTPAGDALEASLTDSAQQLAQLEQERRPMMDERAPASVLESIEVCAQASAAAEEALAGANALQVVHQAQITEVWEEIRRAQKQAAKLDV